MPLETGSPDLFRRRPYRGSHRQKRLALRLLRQFLAAVAIVGLPLAVGYRVLTAHDFALADVEIEGLERVPEGWARGALEPLHGRHMLWLGLADVEAHLLDNEWVRGIAIRKDLPRRLLVTVEEKRPVALLRGDDGLFYLDSKGVVITAFEPSLGAADLPIVSGLAPGRATALEALAIARRWASALGEPSEIEIVGPDDFRIFSDRYRFPVLLSGGAIDTALERLPRLLPAIERRLPRIAELDLRYRNQIVIQPAAGPRSEEGSNDA